jgi:hypothetical protein
VTDPSVSAPAVISEPRRVESVVEAKSGPAIVAIAAETFTASKLVADAGPSLSRVDPLQQSILDTEKANRELRKPLAMWAIWVATGQLAVMNACLVLLGWGVIKFESTLFHWYMAETFGALLGVAHVVFKYLFPTPVVSSHAPAGSTTK